MQVESRSIREIKPYEHNPRRNDGAVDAVAASIKEFGFQQPIVVDKDGVIIAGHTRYKAAKKLGLNIRTTKSPCLKRDMQKYVRKAERQVKQALLFIGEGKACQEDSTPTALRT